MQNFSTFLKILKFQRLVQEFLNQYFACLYRISMHFPSMVNLNIVTKFQNFDRHMKRETLPLQSLMQLSSSDYGHRPISSLDSRPRFWYSLCPFSPSHVSLLYTPASLHMYPTPILPICYTTHWLYYTGPLTIANPARTEQWVYGYWMGNVAVHNLL